MSLYSLALAAFLFLEGLSLVGFGNTALLFIAGIAAIIAAVLLILGDRIR